MTKVVQQKASSLPSELWWIPDIKYTHGNKLGNTFSSWGKFEKICFPFFLAILKFLSHIFHTLA